MFSIETMEEVGKIYAIEMKFEQCFKTANDLHLLKVEILDENVEYVFEYNGFVSVKKSSERFVKMILLEKNAEF